jgi:hypothetical protein
MLANTGSPRHDVMLPGTLRPCMEAAPTRSGDSSCETSNPSLRAPLRRSLLTNLSAQRLRARV